MEEQEYRERAASRGRKMRKIGIAVLVLLALIALILWLLSREADPAVVPPPAEDVPAAALPSSPAAVVPPPASAVVESEAPPSPTADRESALKRLAMTFAERYGSYSTEGNFENLLDLTVMMSQDMAAATEAFVEAARAARPAGEAYAGTTTRALSAEVVSLEADSGKATVSVLSQRRDTGAGPADERIYYQSLEIEFLTVDGSWQVDSASWREVNIGA